MMKIDVFCHFLPVRYRRALYKKAQRSLSMQNFESNHNATPALFDISLRFKIMDIIDNSGGLRQVLSISGPPLEKVVSPYDAIELAKLANDETAELINKHADRFLAGVATLPMNNVDAACKEAERAIQELKMKGVQIYTPCDGKPLDSPIYFPLYEMMTKYDLPIWLHPIRDNDMPDYMSESYSKYSLSQIVGWPYETTVAMMRIVLSGILEKYASLKIITHHCGGMVPYFAGRLKSVKQIGMNEDAAIIIKLSRPTIEYLKMFYADTALSGYTPGLMCGYSFFGADHILFGTDMPFGEVGDKISAVEQMTIPDKDKYKLFEGNAKRLLHVY